MNPIGATLFCHNAFDLDYCIREALASLKGCCTEIVIVDAESNDGTKEWLEKEAKSDSRIALYHDKWTPNPGGVGTWLADLGNLARSKLKAKYHLALQADEVIHEEDYWYVQSAAILGAEFFVHRLNFWKDGRHLVPHRKVCGHHIARMGPSHLPFTGDAENLELVHPLQQSKLRIFHYGFIREDKAQKKKSMFMEETFFRTHNPVLDRMDAEGRKVFDDQYPDNELLVYEGTHPTVAIPWLKERGRI